MRRYFTKIIPPSQLPLSRGLATPNRDNLERDRKIALQKKKSGKILFDFSRKRSFFLQGNDRDGISPLQEVPGAKSRDVGGGW